MKGRCISLCANNAIQLACLGLVLVLLTGCATRPPKNPDNLCEIFQSHRSWYKSALATEKKWGVPVNVPMAIMYQESAFNAGAKPGRNYTFFGLIPWGRKSSAYGYSQALDGTWKHYIEDTNRRWADRSNFADAIDFMGWYINKSYMTNKVSKADAYGQYLNYHDGWTGYKRNTWQQKPWLQKIANRVDERSKRYQSQYAGCKQDLARGFWGRLFQ